MISLLWKIISTGVFLTAFVFSSIQIHGKAKSRKGHFPVHPHLSGEDEINRVNFVETNRFDRGANQAEARRSSLLLGNFLRIGRCMEDGRSLFCNRSGLQF